MANYRPKSLDELNNLYDKSLNAQHEIAKKATVLEEKTQPKVTAFAPENTQPEVKTREQAANDQISGYVNDFIKSFGTPVKPDRTAAATVTASMKTVPIGKPAAPVKENEAVKAAAEAHTEDKPRLIRNSERNSLFENYKKVMDDEDDYDFSEPHKDKRKPKKLFEKKAVKSEEENKQEASKEEKKAEAEKTEEVKPAEAPAKETAPVKPDVKEEKPAKLEESEVEAKQEPEATEEKPEKKKRSKAKKEKSPKEKKEKAPKEKKVKAPKESKATVSRAVVMFLIFCVLISATAVGAVKAFSGVNSDELVMGKYRVYTADRDYSRLGIYDGDLVIVEHKGIDYNDIFAYQTSNNEYGFARLTTVLNDESVIADDGDLRCLVFNNTVRGVLYKTIPGVGVLAAFIMSDFIIVLGALLLVAFILMLVAVFGCKPKAKKEKPEKVKKEKKAKKEKKEKPEKVKKEKKSKKSKKAEAEEIQPEDIRPEDITANEDDETSDYDAIEADFSFLLQEYMEDEAEEVTEDEAAEENESEAEEAPVEDEVADDEAAEDEVEEAIEEAVEEVVEDIIEEAAEEFAEEPVKETIEEIYSRYNISDYSEDDESAESDNEIIYKNNFREDPNAKYKISDYTEDSE